MKSLRILNSLLLLLLIQLVLSIILILSISIPVLSDIENNTTFFKILNQPQPVKENIYLIVFFYMVTLVCYCSNVYGIYLIKKSVTNFTKLELFTPGNINNFSQAGWIFIGSFLILKIATIFIQIDLGFISSKINIDIENIALNPINGLLIGLLLLVLSRVFKIAMLQKEENIELKQETELTI